jgi:hypothetical protein
MSNASWSPTAIRATPDALYVWRRHGRRRRILARVPLSRSRLAAPTVP